MFRIFRASGLTLPIYQRRIVIATAIASGSILWYSTSNRIHNDAPSFSENRLKLATTSFADLVGRGCLRTIVWGSNRAKLLLPESPSDEFRVPTAATWLDNVALRDLAFHNEHAAFVDVHGDVYQWGPKFFSTGSPPSSKPRLTLKGKNIKCVQLTETKVYALSTSGKIYTLSSVLSDQQPRRISTKSTWLSALFAKDEPTDFVEVVPKEKLSWGEQISSIVAGDDHLLAVTSKGRTFAHPVNRRANLCGQLGLRKVEVQQFKSGKTDLVSMNLIPKSFVDPFKEASRAAFETPTHDERDCLDDKDIHFCPLLFEIPALRGIFVDQVAAGSRSSFARTSTGRVLAWGANEHGQLGLGDSPIQETVVVPTEVILWRFTPPNVRTKCVNVTAGGDLTSFLVERSPEESKTSSVDLLMCGNGQWGGLGNDTYRNAQNTPVKAKNVSGLQEYNEQRKSLNPIRPHHISISPTGHVLLTLNSGGRGGRDVVAWGRNLDGELGNGKKASIAVPTTMEDEDGRRVMLVSKKVEGKWIEQRAAVGNGTTIIYWRILP